MNFKWCQNLQKHNNVTILRLNYAAETQLSAETTAINIKVIYYKDQMSAECFCTQVFIIGFQMFTSLSKKFLQAILLSGNLVPRFQHFLHLCFIHRQSKWNKSNHKLIQRGCVRGDFAIPFYFQMEYIFPNHELRLVSVDIKACRVCR